MGDPTKVRVWNRIEVHAGKVASPATPADGDAELVGTDWDLVGLIDPEGFEDNQDISNEAIKDYTGLTVRRVNNEFSQMVVFTAMEDNDTVRGLAAPGSSDTAIVVPFYDQFPLAIELYDGTYRERRIASVGAVVTKVEKAKKTRTTADTTKITAEVIPAADNTLFIRQIGTVA